MTAKNTDKNLPTLLFIADPNDEDWISLCSNYKNKIIIEQTTWDRISLVSESDQKYPTVPLGPLENAIYDFQKKIRYNIKPSL